MREHSSPESGRSGKRLGRDAIFAIGARVLSGVLAFASVLLATRLLTPVEYGELSLLLATAGVVYALIASWSAPPMYAMAAEELGRTGTMRQTSTARVVVLLGTSTVSVGVALLAAATVGVPQRLSVLFVGACGVAAFGSILCEHVATLLETSGRYGVAALVQSTRPAVYLLALLVLLLSAPANGYLPSILGALIASWTAAGITAVGVAATALAIWPPRTSVATLRRLWRASWPLILFSISQVVFGTVDIYFVRLFCSAADVGHYGLAYQCLSMGLFLTSALPALITPRLARAQAAGQDVVAAYVRVIGRTVLPLLGALLALAAPFVPLVVRLVFGDAYSPSGAPTAVLSVALLLLLGSAALGPVLLVAGLTRVIGRVAVLAVATNIALDLVLLGWWRVGIVGPGVATVLASFITWLAYSRAAASRAETQLENRFLPLLPATFSVVGTLLLPWPVAVFLGALAAAALLAYLRTQRRLDIRPRRPSPLTSG